MREHFSSPVLDQKLNPISIVQEEIIIPRIFISKSGGLRGSARTRLATFLPIYSDNKFDRLHDPRAHMFHQFRSKHQSFKLLKHRVL